MSERRAGRTNGIAIGLGIGFILLGVFGWLDAAFMYGALSPIFEGLGLDPSSHYVFRELNWLLASYQTITVAGVAALLLGVLFEMKQGLRRFSESSRNRLAGAMWGGGGALVLMSLLYLFYYIRVPDSINLEFFVTVAPIGVLLIVLGTIAYDHNRKKLP